MHEPLPADLKGAHEEIRRLRAETARLRSQAVSMPDPRDVERLESEQQLRLLFEHAVLAVILGDLRTGRAIAVNPAFERLLGYAAEEVSFDRIQGISHPEDAPQEAVLLQEMLSGQRRHYCMDKRFFHKDGHVVWSRITASLARDAEDQPRFFVGMVEDITERKRLEEELMTQNVELKELDRLKSSFVDSVSHELRTPLTSIKGYAEFLEDEIGGALSAEQRAFVAQIVEGSSRLERLVDDLLDFARMEAGTFKLAMRDFDLRQMVVGVAESFHPQAKERTLTVETDVPPGPVWVSGDPGRIEQVLMNLMGNALKFTAPNGQVIVRLAASDAALRVEVQDTGLGVPSTSLSRLFERFYQVDPSMTREVGGAGLGLSISKALIEAHGGRIGAASELGQGSVFWFELPTHAG